MARYVCPSCGSPFNGKKCKDCAYESFSEEITHRTHVHKGEPLVIRDQTRKPFPTKTPLTVPSRNGKSGSARVFLRRRSLPFWVFFWPTPSVC